MALKIRLKPGERAILGNAVITNGPSPAEITLENKVPALRQKDVLAPERARTACEKLYLIIQLMYIDPANVANCQRIFWKASRNIAGFAPSTLGYVERIGEHVLRDEYYKALKVAEKLIRYEEELLSDAQEQRVGV